MNAMEEQIRRLWSLLTGGQPNDDYTIEFWRADLKEVWENDKSAEGKSIDEIAADRVADLTNAVNWLKDNRPQTFKPEYHDLRDACKRAMQGRRKAIPANTDISAGYVPPTPEQIKANQEHLKLVIDLMEDRITPDDFEEWAKSKGYYNEETAALIARKREGNKKPGLSTDKLEFTPESRAAALRELETMKGKGLRVPGMEHLAPETDN